MDNASLATNAVKTSSPIPIAPEIRDTESFGEVAHKLAYYLIEAVDSPLGWEDLRSSKHVKRLQPLIDRLANDVHHPAVVAALIALKGHFKAIESDDDCGINESRGLACELVAWQFVLTLSERDALDYLLFELHEKRDDEDEDDEESRLLQHRDDEEYVPKHAKGEGFAESFLNLNTLEMATVSGAKKFLSQRCVQDMIDGIWRGDVIFWESLSVNAKKKATLHSKKNGKSDPWTRLRVPRYMKTFEIFFFLAFLGLFYTVSIERVLHRVTIWEIVYYLFVAGFTWDEITQFMDSGAEFYSVDIWGLWDMGIIFVGVTFFVMRMVGLGTGHDSTLETSFSVLALHSLFLTPRIFSLLSLSPYYGSLLPCLKEMGKQFFRFLGFVLIIFVGFFSTFILLARGHIALQTVCITTLKVFFGAGVVGFDIAPQISPILGLPVMVVFVCLTNQLLITTMMAHISQSLRTVLDSSREEYLYVYSVYVLEASTSNKLTYFFPPFNLVPVVLFNPLLLILPHDAAQQVRILLLKATHAPFVVIIWGFERWEAWQTKEKAAEQQNSWNFGNVDTVWNANGNGSGNVELNAPVKGNKQVAQIGASRKSLKAAERPKMRVPASLILQASRRPKRDGKSQASNGQQLSGSASRTWPNGQKPQNGAAGRVNTSVTVPATPATPATASGQDSVGGGAHSSTFEADMMRMVKELSAQVEELRAYVVKVEEGEPGQS